MTPSLALNQPRSTYKAMIDLHSECPSPRFLTKLISQVRISWKQVGFMAPTRSYSLSVFCLSRKQHEELGKKMLKQEKVYTFTDCKDYFKQLLVYQFPRPILTNLYLFQTKNNQLMETIV